MSMLQKQAYCHSCQRNTLHQMANAETNKSMAQGHGCLTVMTCGLWLPIALIWAVWHGWQVGRQRYHCVQCGRAN